MQTLRGQVGMAQTTLTPAFVGHLRVVTLLGQEGDIETQTASTPLNDRCIIGTSPIYHAVLSRSLDRRCGCHRAEDAEGETRHRRHGTA